MHTVVELSGFTAKASRILSDDEKVDAVTMISANPLCGDLIRGTGGIRKVRLALSGRGKSGGARVVYYFRNEGMPVYLLTVFAKNEKENLSQSERNQLKSLVHLIVREWKERNPK